MIIDAYLLMLTNVDLHSLCVVCIQNHLIIIPIIVTCIVYTLGIWLKQSIVVSPMIVPPPLYVRTGCSEDYLLTLAESLLSLESPTRGKFILLSSLSRHLSSHKFLKASPQLPSELMSVMGQQALACHVRAHVSKYLPLLLLYII